MLLSFVFGGGGVSGTNNADLRRTCRYNARVKAAEDWDFREDFRGARDQFLSEIEENLRFKNFRQANRKYDEMYRRLLISDVATYNRVLHLFGNLESPERARRILKTMDKNCDPNTISFNTVMSSYAKKRDVRMVARLFEEGFSNAALEPNEYSYTILLNAYASVGNDEQVDRVLEEMKQRSIQPNVVTMTSMMRAFAKRGDAKTVTRIFSEMEDKGPVPDRVTYTVLLHSLGQAGQVEKAEHVFKRMLAKRIQPDVVVIATMMSMYLKAQDYLRVRDYYELLEEYRLPVNDPIASILMEVVEAKGNVREAERLFEELCGSVFVPTHGMLRSLMSVYGSVGDIKGVRKCFRTMRVRGIKPEGRDFSILFNACADAGGWMDLADAGWEEMMRLGVKPPVATVNAILRSCIAAADADRFAGYYGFFKKNRIRPNIVSYTLKMTMLGSTGDLSAASAVVEELKQNGSQPDVALFNNLMKMYAERGDKTGVQNTLNTMQANGLVANARTVSFLVRFYTEEDELELAEQTYCTAPPEIQENGVVRLSLMKLYTTRGSLDKALALYDSMRSANMGIRRRALQLLIVGCGLASNPAMLARAETFTTESSLMDQRMSNALITAWIRCGSDESALRCAAQSEKDGIVFNEVSYTALVSVLRRLKKYELAEKFQAQAKEKGMVIP